MFFELPRHTYSSIYLQQQGYKLLNGKNNKNMKNMNKKNNKCKEVTFFFYIYETLSGAFGA